MSHVDEPSRDPGGSRVDADSPILGPGDPGYDEARSGWNGRFDLRPTGVVRASGPPDVVAALRTAKDRALYVGVKSGGHDYAGNSAIEGGLLIDLDPMDSVSVDPDARHAIVGPGARWADVDAATQAHGLATPGGTVSTVGVAGFTLGGGEGWLGRKHGLSCDNLMAAEVVTAAGEIVRADETENPDLLWALRGGSGNFGIVTSLELALHPLDHEILAGQVIYPFDRAGELLRFYRDHFRHAPDETACFPFVYRVPPIAAFPEEWHGDLVLAFVLAYMGPVEEGERHLAPFRGRDGMLVDGLAPQPYVDLQRSFDETMGQGNRWYSRAHCFDSLSDDAIDAFLGHLEPLPGDFTTAYLVAGGGAIGRVPADATAYPHRRAAHEIHIFPGWVDPARDAEIMAWARGVSDGVAPYSSGGVYVNLLAEDEEDRIPAAYGSNYERLSRLKAKWDPENVFRRNHNIAPMS